MWDPAANMVARAQEVVEGLRSKDKTARLKSLKMVKNQIIGNKAKKQTYLDLGAVSVILDILANEEEHEFQIQSAVAIGSFGCGYSASLAEIVQHHGIKNLIQKIFSHDPKVVEAGIRSLKLIYQTNEAPQKQLLEAPVVTRLVELLGAVTSLEGSCEGADGAVALLAPDVADAAAAVLARCCASHEERTVLTEAGAVPGLAKLLLSARKSSKAGALAALAALLRSNPLGGFQLVGLPHLLPVPSLDKGAPSSSASDAYRPSPATASAPDDGPQEQLAAGASTSVPQLDQADAGEQHWAVFDALLSMLRDSSPECRLLAATCVTNMAAACGPHLPYSGGSSGPRGAGCADAQRGQKPRVTSSRSFQFPQMPELFKDDGCGQQAGSGSQKYVSTAPQLGEEADMMDEEPAQRAGENGEVACEKTKKASSASSRPGAAEEVDSKKVTQAHELAAQIYSARRVTLPVLVRLLNDTVFCEAVPPILARLIEASEDLQRVAADADLVRVLASLLTLPGRGSAMKEGVLRALASLCLSHDPHHEGRRQLIEAKVIPHVVRALQDPGEGVRAAGAVTLMAASRSVRALRSNVFDAEAAEALCRLLKDPSLEVQVNAVAAICNLGMEFCNARSTIVSQDVLQSLSDLACSMSHTLRMHSSWALRNLSYKSDVAFKEAVMQKLPWTSMRALLSDPEVAVQEQAVCIVRNLCLDASVNISNAFKWAGSDLLAVLEEKLDPERDVCDGLREHAMYTVVNILVGSEEHKNRVAASGLPALIVHHMRRSSASQVCLPSVWCVVNMVWPDAVEAAGVAARARRLDELGARDALTALQSDSSMDVQERVKTALEHMQSALAASG